MEEHQKRARKKVSRACKSCQQSHSVCDAGRPCSRCQRKGLDCEDGSFKKAKYLKDIEIPYAHATTTDDDDDKANGLDADAYDGVAGNNGGEGCVVQENNNFESLNEAKSLLTLPSHSEDAVKSIYYRVTKPYQYSQNFNNLLRYISQRLSKENIFRVCRAISIFRPSLIAVIRNLTEEDLLFKERCCQRMLMEYTRILNDFGDPSAIWRRTGEILHISAEFTFLTQWSRESLQSKTSYIYELMDDKSLVNYWEKYSSISFNNSEQSCTMNCNLKSPNGDLIRCALCFTIKRSIFDIPMLIIGNFLPILSAPIRAPLSSPTTRLVLHGISIVTICLLKTRRSANQLDRNAGFYARMGYINVLLYHLFSMIWHLTSFSLCQSRVSEGDANAITFPLFAMTYMSTNLATVASMAYFMIAWSKLTNFRSVSSKLRSFLDFFSKPTVLFPSQLFLYLTIVTASVVMIAAYGRDYPRNYEWVRLYSNVIRALYVLGIWPLILELAIIIHNLRKASTSAITIKRTVGFFLFTISFVYVLILLAFLIQLRNHILSPDLLFLVKDSLDPGFVAPHQAIEITMNLLPYSLVGVGISFVVIFRNETPPVTETANIPGLTNLSVFKSTTAGTEKIQAPTQ